MSERSDRAGSSATDPHQRGRGEALPCVTGTTYKFSNMGLGRGLSRILPLPYGPNRSNDQ
jgi:hypothetical protein